MRIARALVLVPLIVALVAMPAAAADIRQGDTITIPPTQTLEDDLYAFGQNIDIQGTVRGDVIAAGMNVTVDGTVTGDLIAAAQTVSVRGQVQGSVRAAGATVFIDGRVTEDLFAAANDVTISGNGRVGRDAVLAGNGLTLGGEIGRHLQVGAGQVTIDGRVGGDVRAQVETLRLTERAVVEGSLSYMSEREATIASGAAVRGDTSRIEPPQEVVEAEGPAALAIDWVRGLVGLLILGLFLVFFFPGFCRRSGEALVRSPIFTFAIGAAFLIGVPIVAVILFIVGAIIGGWWLGLVLLAFYFAAIAVSIPIAALGLGASILRITQRPAHVAIALIVGLVILLLVGLVPILGGIVMLLAVLFGLGATTIAVAGGRSAEPVPA